MQMKKFLNPLLLFVTAFIWGVAFVAQKSGSDTVGPFFFNGLRSVIAGVALLPVIALLGNRAPQPVDGVKNRKTLILGGVLCGTALFAATYFQQLGMTLGTDAGKSGFITALYIVLVPILGIFLKKRATIKTWISVLIAVVGLYLLCVTGGFSVQLGDLMVLVCALLFAVHILVIDHFSPRVESVKMACIQFFVCSILSGIMMLFTETPTIHDIFAAWMPILYAGVLSCGVAYTLQIVGQKDFNPTIASLILSLESVFSALAGWLILHQALSKREVVGCVLIFCAILLAQIPWKKKKDSCL